MSSPEKPSTENTCAEPEDKPTDLTRISEAGHGTLRQANATAQIELELAKERDSRKEERFVWGLGAVILLDIIVAPSMDWHMSWLIFLELIFIFVFGRFCGVDYIYEETQKALDTYQKFRNASKDDGENDKD